MIDPRPRLAGAGVRAAGSIRASATMTARKLRALSSRAGPTPQTAMVSPATAGPTRRAAWKDVVLSPTAFGMSPAGTISGANDWRAGPSNAAATPCRVASTYTCHNCTQPPSTRTARTKPVAARAASVSISILRFECRSAIAPAQGASRAIGRNCRPVTTPSEVAELSVSSVSTSQSCATRAIHVPTLEMNPPMKKSR